MQDRLYVSEHPTGSHVDAFSVYCTSCGNWLGWRIVRIYIFQKLIHFLFDIYMLIWQHDCPPVIHEGQFVLVVCGDGAGIEVVYPM